MIDLLDPVRGGEDVRLSRLASAAAGGAGEGSVTEAMAACARALLDLRGGGDGSASAFFVPGRIEVLGKHTDYAGGRSLLAAVNRGFTLLSIPRDDERVRVRAVGGETAEFALSAELVPGQGWSNYPMTVARRLSRDFPGRVRGADIAFVSDLPPASGMSSSSALIIGAFLCLATARDLGADERFAAVVRDRDDLASYLAAVESGQGYAGLARDSGVGTHGGSQDHTAILQSVPEHLVRYRFVPAEREDIIPLPRGYRFAIASSGVHAEKAGAMRDRYNRAAALVRSLLELWNRESDAHAGSLAAACRSAPDAADRLRRLAEGSAGGPFSSADLTARLEQFLHESEEIVPAAADALLAVELERFGSLVDRSQQLSERLLGNQVPETVALARLARSMGAVAASAFGAGFGGSVWALVEEPRILDFLAAWGDAYRIAFPEAARSAVFLSTPAAEPARRLV